MDCPHLSDGVKIDRLFVRNKIRSEFNELDKRDSPDSTTASDSISVRKGQLGKCSWKCLGVYSIAVAFVVLQVTIAFRVPIILEIYSLHRYYTHSTL